MDVLSRDEYNVQHLRTILKIATSLGITPRYDFEVKKILSGTSHRIYAVVFGAIMASLTILEVKNRADVHYRKISTTEIVIELSCTCLVLIFCLLAIVNVNIFKRKQFETLLTHLQEINDVVTMHRTKQQKRYKNMYIRILILILYCISIVVTHINTTGLLSYYISDCFLMSYKVIALFIMITTVQCLYNGHLRINRILVMITKRYANIRRSKVEVVTRDSNCKWILKTVIDLRDRYTKYVECVELFNSIFGCMLLINILCNISFYKQIICLIMKVNFKEQDVTMKISIVSCYTLYLTYPVS